jgi:hypothetical protein
MGGDEPEKSTYLWELDSHCFNVQSIKSKQDASIENRIDKS